jgi:hypothetical protein
VVPHRAGGGAHGDTRHLGIAIAIIILRPAVGAPASDTDKCQLGRYKAAGKYEYCFRKGVPRDGLSSGFVLQPYLLKCRLKFARAYAKLGAALPGTSCAPPRFVDNGDGTVSDRMTRLQWEQKDGDDGMPDAGDAHDVDNVYTWSVGAPDPTTADGTIFTSFLPSLNAACLGGHCDWRLPTFSELLTLLSPADCEATPPCVDPMLAPAAVAYYSGSTRSSEGPGPSSWAVLFNGGAIVSFVNTAAISVRAVRGGF